MELGLIDVVNKDDKVIATKERLKVKNNEIVRVTGIFILNNKNEILLQKRAAQSFKYPNHWDCSAGGHVDSGESYNICANRELFEEIGIKTKLEFLGKDYFKLPDGRHHFISSYKGTYNKEFKLDKTEVSDVQFFSFEQIKELIKNKEKIHHGCLFALEKYIFSN